MSKLKQKLANKSVRKYNVPCDLTLQKGFWLKTLNFLGMCQANPKIEFI